MTKAVLMVTTCATLLFSGVALAATTPQQKCDYARVVARRSYLSCMKGTIAKTTKYNGGRRFAALARCRHRYFKNWTTFQLKPSLAGSACSGNRHTDNGDGTVTDNLSGLVWEKKTTDGSVHDEGNQYTWSASGTAADGSVFQDFLVQLNALCFAGQCDWRLPTIAELQTIELDFTCTGSGGDPSCSCPSSPCIDPTLGLALVSGLWSSTDYAGYPDAMWYVEFSGGVVDGLNKKSDEPARAVRGGF